MTDRLWLAENQAYSLPSFQKGLTTKDLIFTEKVCTQKIRRHAAENALFGKLKEIGTENSIFGDVAQLGERCVRNA
jgi:hypothetical protein